MKPILSAPDGVLVYVGRDLVGDGLIKLPFVRALRGTYPDARITWLAGKGPSVYAGGLAPLVAGLIDEVVDQAGIGSRPRELLRRPLAGTPLAGRRFDLVLDTQRRAITSLILRRVPHRLFISGMGGFLLSDRRPSGRYRKPPAMARQMLDLIEVASGRRPTVAAPITLEARYTAAAAALLPAGPTYVGLVPGAGGRHKCWPLNRFTALARGQAERGRVPVFLLGPDEASWAAELARRAPQAVLPLQSEAAAGFDASPLLTIALGRRLAAGVANDCGGGHMLAASDSPLVSLFGPTAPEKFAPIASRARVLAAQEFGAGDAMAAIPLAAVEDALESLLAAAPPGVTATG